MRKKTYNKLKGLIGVYMTMNEKEKLSFIAGIEKGIKMEETAIPLYSKHIRNTLFLSGLEQNLQTDIKDLLDKLIQDCEHHRNIFNNILEELKKG